MKTHYLLLALLCSAVTSCSSENSEPSTPADASPAVRLSIASISTGAISRAENPSHIYGWDNENEIVDAQIIITDEPINSASTTGTVVKVLSLSNSDLGPEVTNSHPVEAIHYFNSSGVEQTLATLNGTVAHSRGIQLSQTLATELLSGLDRGRYYYATAIVNFGNETPITVGTAINALVGKGTASALYDTNAHPENNTPFRKYGKFKMTAINEVKFSTTPNAEGDIDLGTLMVQRLAARVELSFGNLAYGDDLFYDTYTNSSYPYDFDDKGGTDDDKKYRFPIYQAGTNPPKRIAGAYFDLDEIKLINCITSGAYIYERANGGTPAYLSNEGWTDGVPTRRIQTYKSNQKTFTDIEIASPTGTNIQNAINPITYDTEMTGTNWAKSALLGYIYENTFTSYSADNAYTAIVLAGETNLVNDHLNAELTGSDHTRMSGQINIRHAATDASNPMTYAVVRNTIYRIFVRFFSDGSSISVRYYYYNGSTGNFTEKDYETAKFNQYILEGTSSPSND